MGHRVSSDRVGGRCDEDEGGEELMEGRHGVIYNDGCINATDVDDTNAGSLVEFNDANFNCSLVQIQLFGVRFPTIHNRGKVSRYE